MSVDSVPGPRLYLDTAVILDLVDNRLDAGYVRDLIASLREKNVVLVLSLQHFQDALPRASIASASKLAEGLARFPRLAIARTGPHPGEHWNSERGDLTLESVTDIGQTIESWRGSQNLVVLAESQQLLHAALQRSQELRRNHPLTGDTAVVVFAGVLKLILANESLEASDLVTVSEEQESICLPESQREEAIAHLRLWVEVMHYVNRNVKLTREQRRQTVRSMRESYASESNERSPGLYLSSALMERLWSNTGRNRKRSDSVDGIHTRYFPYVDVATCDGQTYDGIKHALKDVRTTRALKVLRNNDRAGLMLALQALRWNDDYLQPGGHN